MSRITIILHPNTSRVDVVLNDRMFNKERYSHSRDREAAGAEKVLLDVLNDCTVGVERASASKNTLSLDIADGMLHAEYMPAVIRAVQKFVGESDYKPVIACEDRRYSVAPEYRSDGWTEKPGIRVAAGKVDIGLEYQAWVA